MIKIKKKKSRKIRLPITISLYKDDVLIRRATFRKKTSVFRFIQVNSFDEGYLKIHYGNGLYNDCYFGDYGDLKNSLDLFTEKGIIDYIEGKI